MDVPLFVLLHNSSFCSIKIKKTCYTAVQVLHSDLSSWCSLFLSWTSSCPCGVSSSCVHWTLLKLQKNLSLRSRCCSCQRNWTKLALFSWTCCLSAAPYWVWELLQKIKINKVLVCFVFCFFRTRYELWPLTFRHWTRGGKRWYRADAGEVFDLVPQELSVLHQVFHLSLQSCDALLFALQHALQPGDGQQHTRRKVFQM